MRMRFFFCGLIEQQDKYCNVLYVSQLWKDATHVHCIVPTADCFLPDNSSRRPARIHCTRVFSREEKEKGTSLNSQYTQLHYLTLERSSSSRRGHLKITTRHRVVRHANQLRRCNYDASMYASEAHFFEQRDTRRFCVGIITTAQIYLSSDLYSFASPFWRYRASV